MHICNIFGHIQGSHVLITFVVGSSKSSPPNRYLSSHRKIGTPSPLSLIVLALIRLNFKIAATKVDDEWWNKFRPEAILGAASPYYWARPM